jgi:carboxylate-amine ligase
LNLPFDGEEEFAKLHAAIRLILPLLPGLCASSPIIGGKSTGLLDTRLSYYKTNQEKIKSITGSVIPEAVFSANDYQRIIYDPIKKDIAPFDPEDVLDSVWVNSRGAISRFDRGSIEIRLMDVQECPAADLAIQTLVVETIKAFVREEFISLQHQMKWDPEPLAEILDNGIKKGERTVISNRGFLKVFGSNAVSLTMGELWKHIADRLKDRIGKNEALEIILDRGCVSTRILRTLKGDYSTPSLLKVYRQLANCLAENQMFIEK